jgi:hypothetical protein
VFDEHVSEPNQPEFELRMNVVVEDSLRQVKATGIQGIIGLAPSPIEGVKSFGQTLVERGVT